jgi:hypothetical protein
LEWPLPVSVISDKDRQWRRLVEQEEEIRQRMSREPVQVGI